jgi:DNA repair exonuclease SbcCD ATPase subunit
MSEKPKIKEEARAGVKDEPRLKKAESGSEVTAPIENLTEMVDQAAGKIAFLKKKQEELAKRKADLEELKRQRGELDLLKREALTNLERGIAILDKEESELTRTNTMVRATRQEFEKIISEVRGIREDTWAEEDLKGELSRALAVVAKAKRGYTAARGKVDALSTRGLEESRAPEFSSPVAAPDLFADTGALFRKGFIFFLPAALLTILIVILVRLLASLT